MSFENIKNGINSNFLKYFEEVKITETGVSKVRSGAEAVANQLMELSRYVGDKYGYNPRNISENELLDILNESGVTEDEVTLLMKSKIGELNAKGEKPSIDDNLNNHPELIEMRDKIAGYLNKAKIAA